MCMMVYLVADRPLPEIDSEVSRIPPYLGIEPLPALSVRLFEGVEKERVCQITGPGLVYPA